MKTELLGLSFEEILVEFEKIGQKKFRGAQFWKWLYFRGETNFENMTDFSKDFREKLKNEYSITKPQIVCEQISVDGTRKWLLSFADGQKIEMVYIPEEDRGAVCLSTQVGCAVGCKFCHTGSQKLTRNLTSGEIVGQFMIARDILGEWGKKEEEESRKLSNIVVMGMGEPLHNTNNVIKALNILSDPEGIEISKRKITLSTSGIAPEIVSVAKETGVKLAISLHAPNNVIRSKIMPINDRYCLEEVMKACVEYQKIVSSRYITFEYIMLKGINDSIENARELVSLMKKYRLGAKFNLIAFNPWQGAEFEPSSKATIKAFSQELERGGFVAPIRTARGQDILAACGQLKSEKGSLSV